METAKTAADQIMANPAKKLKTEPKTIGTHNGAFHADEALAVYLLRLTPAYKDSPVTRSRDPPTLEACDIIVDVTGVYDGTKHFDHHQRTFTETFSPNHITKLSSAGLIYKHFGKEIISLYTGADASSPTVEILFQKLYSEFIEAIDANDNGISAFPSSAGSPAFSERGITLPAMVGGLNPRWNEEITDEISNRQFEKASKLMGDAFVAKLDYYAKAWLPAREIVVEAVKNRMETDPSGKIINLGISCPWKEHLFRVEEELGIPGETLYALYSDGKGWRIQAVSVSKDSFENRKGLPEKWRGVRDDDLSTLTGIDGCVFVHASGFIGGNKTEAGALEMARRAVAE
ncbi:hypothetical protein H072_6837 [Dactylellina haptotyla CBS 200.50]|uniref:Metal-dependent protein hydrolase n=1 Tax=Dactylellina haptotyla (strain CBS 200.50) TaxID=1284197 RepID=S8A8Q4_DACHA|nr:hypothetical protein H072_6837 [Dactylellina haptotyla CBS 200.50]